MLTPGQVWMKKNNIVAVVRQVVAVDGKKVDYKVLYNPLSPQQKTGRCHIKSFLRDFRQIEPMKDYSLLDGARIYETYMVLGVLGQPLFRCNQKRALWYLSKGYVTKAGDHQVQFTNDVTEKTLERIYKGNFSDFFMAIKNDKCACCGKAARLTRHHVVPQCHKKRIPPEARKYLSNVLFICMECHKKYDHEWKPEEPQPGESWKDYILAWKNHFMKTMEPKFLPAGWDIFSRPMP